MHSQSSPSINHKASSEQSEVHNFLFDRFAGVLAMGFALTLPWRLSIAYVFLFPLILLWLYRFGKDIPSKIGESYQISVPLIFFLLVVSLSSLFGDSPLRSISNIPGLFFFSLTILAVADVVKVHGLLKVLLALLIGQSVASLHSIFEAALSGNIPRLFVGAVTESGQLAVVLIVALGFAFHLLQQTRQNQQQSLKPPYGIILGCILFSISWISSAHVFSQYDLFAGGSIDITNFLVFCGFVLVLILSVLVSTSSKVDFLFRLPQGSRLIRVIYFTIIPLLTAALVLNLKRGPWMGVLVAGAILTLFYHKKLLLPLAAFAIFGYLGLQPVRTRIAEIPEHFYITGGRSVLWDIGVNLSTRYPLGVGFKNSRILQKFSDEIPHEMNHFHNNFINIVVESGWLALAIFLWWLISCINFSFKRHNFPDYQIVALSIGLAIISWQIAGLAEYNWGDSEVRIMIFLVLGMLLGLTKKPSPSS